MYEMLPAYEIPKSIDRLTVDNSVVCVNNRLVCPQFIHRRSPRFCGKSSAGYSFFHGCPHSYPQSVDNLVDVNCKINLILIIFVLQRGLFRESFFLIIF